MDRYLGLTVNMSEALEAPCEICLWQSRLAQACRQLRNPWGQRCAKQEAAFHVSAIALLRPCK